MMKRFGRECRSWIQRYMNANAHRALGVHPWFRWRCEMDYRPTVSIPTSAVITSCNVNLTASDIDGLLRQMPAVGTVTLRPSEVLGSQEEAVR